MAPEPSLQQAVDEVLEAAWPNERRRAVLRTASSTFGRLATFLLALLASSWARTPLAWGLTACSPMPSPWAIWRLP